VVQNTVAQVTGGESKAVEAGKSIWKALGSGLTVSPLITGLVRLFTRDSEKEPPPLVSYVHPAPVQYEGPVARRAVTESVTSPVPPAAPQPAPQVTIQVQAMDSRSFLDHSSEIARAVREAMLNSHSLNDVVNEL
jgi:hypothetical protein